MINLTRASGVVLRQYYLMRNSLTRLLPLFIWVVIDMVVWGFLTRYLNSVAAARFDFVPVMLGAVLFWDFFIRVMWGITMAFFEDVWSRNFLNFFASPLSLGEYLGSLVFTSIATSSLGLIVMFVLAALVFGLSITVYGLALFPFLLILFLFGIAFGIFATGIVLRLGPAAEWFVWPIPAMISPFACVYYPLATLPGWMRVIARLLPASYVFEGMRGIVAGHLTPASAAASSGSLLLNMLAGGVLGILYVLAACWFFRTMFRRAVRTGLLARYSAESVN